MGPTASGKTPLAIELVQRFPCEIISVDSAMVYRGMDIGTAKPNAEVLSLAPHRLISIVDPAEPYSAGQFYQDALREIAAIHANGKIPLLVGGTMLYFRVLQRGLAPLPLANPTIRAQLQDRAEKTSWAGLHAELAEIDPVTAARLQPNDSQRIQRALEVYLLTGKPISAWHTQNRPLLSPYTAYNLALAPTERAVLHARIAQRFEHMLAQGFIEEVQQLYQRHDLTATLPALRAVGYRQAWAYLSGQMDYAAFCDQTLAATRQLAKRQLTWLRTWPAVTWFDSDAADLVAQVSEWVNKLIPLSRPVGHPPP
ncbi:MAG TPA: tRNA (adenosine(37)-N6)-dimethylallyltransferase MiaA [Gammaproteobacteria bacterium]|nr:tRNA (adenosine(37)-N6)-dimethylallyltransferase MiaA [Gammaproteobacteria bacterium]